MPYVKTHKKDYYQFKINLDYDRDADLISFLQTLPNKKLFVLKALAAYICIITNGEVKLYHENVFSISDRENVKP